MACESVWFDAGRLQRDVGVVMNVAYNGQHASTSKPAPDHRFVGWWFGGDGPGLFRIVEQDGHYRVEGSKVNLVVGGERLLEGVPDDGLRGEMRLSPDGRTVTVELFVNDKPGDTWRFHPGTAAEIAAYLNYENRSWLVAEIDEWFAHHGAYPPKSAVRPDGALAAHTPRPWPTNPYSGGPMSPGRQPGDYVYRFSARGLTVEFFDLHGETSTLTEPRPTTRPTTRPTVTPGA